MVRGLRPMRLTVTGLIGVNQREGLEPSNSKYHEWLAIISLNLKTDNESCKFSDTDNKLVFVPFKAQLESDLGHNFLPILSCQPLVSPGSLEFCWFLFHSMNKQAKMLLCQHSVHAVPSTRKGQAWFFLFLGTHESVPSSEGLALSPPALTIFFSQSALSVLIGITHASLPLTLTSAPRCKIYTP